MSPQPKPFQTERKGEALIIRFTEVSGLGKSDLRESVDREMQSPECENVRFAVVDCSDLTFANSMFLETVLDVKHHLDPKGGAVAFANVKDVVREVLRVSRFNELCPIYDSNDEAISALTG